MPPDPVILLPPSEGKSAGGDGPAWQLAPGRFPELDADRRAVIGALQRAVVDAATAARLLGVGGAHLEAAIADDLAIDEAPTRPALERYSGVLFERLGAASLGRGARGRAAREIVIVSGLWGLVAADQALPAYRLKLSAAPAPLGRLSSWWRPRLAESLGRRVEGRVVLDLLPQEHAAVWSPAAERYARRIRVRFEDEVLRGGVVERRVVSHFSKSLKGALARAVLSERRSITTTLAGFAVDGYELDADRSQLRGVERELVWVRPLGR